MATRVGFKKAAAQARRFTAWSYSRYVDYARCPAYANWKYLVKLPEGGGEPNPAMQRGGDLHTSAERFLKGEMDELPPEIEKHFAAEMRSLRKKRYASEHEWAFDDELAPTGWFAANAWLRAKIDAHKYTARSKVIHIVDFKTGKPREDHEGQLELYAFAGFIQYPQAARSINELWYFDQGTIVGSDMDFSRARDFERLRATWLGRVEAMFSDETFAPTPNQGCRWCAFAKSKGGPCRFG